MSIWWKRFGSGESLSFHQGRAPITHNVLLQVGGSLWINHVSQSRINTQVGACNPDKNTYILAL